MKTHRARTKLALPLAALVLLGATVVGVTQQSSTAVAHVQICVKDNGQMRLRLGNTACDASERLVDWVVGGEVTEIQAGRGLIGSRDNSAVQLEIDPAIIENGGNVFAGFNDGPGDISGAIDIIPNSFLGSVQLPAGDFSIFAKLTLRNVDSIDGDSHPVRCKLIADADFDEATVVVEDEQDRNDNGIPDRDAATSLVMSLMVVHHFNEPGSAKLFCIDGTPANSEFGTLADDGDVKYEDLKIIAIKASGISNVFLEN
ncbi:MAG TPA: hypothetical protein VF074_06310 [Pyrinomonadaceae bacterium]